MNELYNNTRDVWGSCMAPVLGNNPHATCSNYLVPIPRNGITTHVHVLLSVHMYPSCHI